MIEPRAAAPMSVIDWVLIGMCALVLMPILSLSFSALGGSGAGQSPFSNLADAALETALLCAGVLVLAFAIGASAGWLVAMHDFPGRKIVSWMLVLPFAIPGYIAAYALVDFLDFFGPVQSGLRHVFSFQKRTDYWFPDMRSRGGAIVVHALTLYPYVYLASRAAFAQQSGSMHQAARLLGCRPFEAAWRVLIPATWPALAAGATMVVLETLNDIGANQYLGVNTLSVAVFNTWQGRNDFAGAAQIAFATLTTVVGIMWIERWLRRPERYQVSSRGGTPATRIKLRGAAGLLAFGACAFPVALGFCAPVSTLMGATSRQFFKGGLPSDFWDVVSDTIFVSSLATLLLLGLSLAGAFALREGRRPWLNHAAQLSIIGYAIPGTVLVIGLLPAIGTLDHLINTAFSWFSFQRPGAVLSGSIVAVVLSYIIRFHAIGLEQTRAGLGLVSRNVDYAGRLLGAKRVEVATKVLIPAIRPSLLAAAILIFVDCLKELPATLLLRPLNFETLATSLYGHASRGSFEDGALSALVIILCGLAALLAANSSLDRAAHQSSVAKRPI